MVPLDFPIPKRDELRDILLRWQRGEITFYQVVLAAEVIEDRLPDLVIEEPLPVAEPWCIPFLLMGELSMGFSVPLFREEIPQLLAYLDTPAGAEIEASERLSAYLERQTLDARIARAEREYSWERDTVG